MNEIIGPIYYVFANDPKKCWSGKDIYFFPESFWLIFLDHTEADTFWCFTSLMSEIRDIFNKHADCDHATGVVHLMNRVVALLTKEDQELCQHINLIQGIKPHYYAFRWITLMLSQEFPLPGLFLFLTSGFQIIDQFCFLAEVLRLWDYLFSDEHRFEFLLKLCCSMIL